MLPWLATQRLRDLKKYMGRLAQGRGGARGGGQGVGGPGREGGVQLLNGIVVEALAALAVEREPEIECNLEFRIPLIKSIEMSYTISYAILHTI